MLNLAQDIRPVSYSKAHSAEILRQLDVHSYQTLVDSLNMMKLVSIGEKQILSGQTVSDDEVTARVKEG